MSSLPASRKRSYLEQLRKSGNTSFPTISIWGFFQKLKGRGGGLTLQSMVISGWILNSSIGFMHVLITCKYQKNRMKNNREKVGNIDFLDAQGQLTLWSMVGYGWISNSSKLSCMSSLPASIKKIGMKNNRGKSGNIDFLDAQGQLTLWSMVGLWLNFELIQAFMHVLITCKYQKDRIKNNGEKVVTLIVLDAQGQLTLWSMVESGRISNLS